eukprot:scaffold122098_cov45-Phaeocystis_antarctica.AAC.2
MPPVGRQLRPGATPPRPPPRLPPPPPPLPHGRGSSTDVGLGGGKTAKDKRKKNETKPRQGGNAAPTGERKKKQSPGRLTRLPPDPREQLPPVALRPRLRLLLPVAVAQPPPAPPRPPVYPRRRIADAAVTR